MSGISFSSNGLPGQSPVQQSPVGPLPMLSGNGPTPGPGKGGDWILPPSAPPQVPPPGSGAPAWPMPPTQGPGKLPKLPDRPPAQQPPTTKPPTTDPPGKDPGGDGGGVDLKPWLIGAGLLGTGVAGVMAIRTGARNVRALQATAAAYRSGGMHQGGMQSIRDAQLGARFASGIGTREYLSVALPVVNRLGTGGKLTSVARGHLDHAELMASAAALRRVSSDGGVQVHQPLRRFVLDQLEQGRAMPSVLDDLDRSAAGAKPAFDNRQVARYWNQTSIVEHGPRAGGSHVTSGVSVDRPRLALVNGELAETGASVRINQLVAGRGADLDGRGLADGLGTVQGVNVSTLNPKMQARAIEAAGVDPALVESIGLNGAFTQRWHDRLALGPATPTPRSSS